MVVVPVHMLAELIPLNLNRFLNSLKVHKHEFFLTFFAETETIWSQGPVTRDFFKNRIQIGGDIQLLNISVHAQHAMKSVPSILSMR
jgi:hypothetical protein